MLAGYSTRRYLLVTAVGIAVWVAQTLLGITVLGVLARISPGFAFVAMLPLLIVPAFLALRRLRA